MYFISWGRGKSPILSFWGLVAGLIIKLTQDGVRGEKEINFNDVQRGLMGIGPMAKAGSFYTF